MNRRIVNLVMLLAGVLSLVPMLAPAQGTFEGSVTGTMTADGKTIPFHYYELGKRVRQEFTIEGNSVAMIIDGASGKMTYMMPQQKKYVVWDVHDANGMGRRIAEAMAGGKKGDTPDFSKMKVTSTGQRETIAGIACEHYRFENTDPEEKGKVDICGAPGMGFMGMEGAIGSMMPSTIALMRSQNPTLARLARQGFFPLKMTMTGDHGTAVWMATEVTRGRPDPALFQPPAGYAELKMGGP